MKTKSTAQKLAVSALFAAFACAATMIIKIPSPLNGYINPGDCIVLTAGWMLSPLYGFFAAGVGSALADLFSGYIVYAPATFLIKGIMALTAWFLHKTLSKKTGGTTARIISGFTAETLMILGYYVLEGFLYGFSASLVNIPANAVQGIAGLVLGLALVKALKKAGFNYM